ncbi:MAG: hypothetical protein M1818_003383 [Claussenomyces sp. TS43310]|nr:MAG: hypothetical protein M1818_003383 [Claussenomyces sp. TS43310]
MTMPPHFNGAADASQDDMALDEEVMRDPASVDNDSGGAEVSQPMSQAVVMAVEPGALDNRVPLPYWTPNFRTMGSQSGVAGAPDPAGISAAPAMASAPVPAPVRGQTGMVQHDAPPEASPGPIPYWSPNFRTVGSNPESAAAPASRPPVARDPIILVHRPAVSAAALGPLPHWTPSFRTIDSNPGQPVAPAAPAASIAVGNQARSGQPAVQSEKSPASKRTGGSIPIAGNASAETESRQRIKRPRLQDRATPGPGPGPDKDRIPENMGGTVEAEAVTSPALSLGDLQMLDDDAASWPTASSASSNRPFDQKIGSLERAQEPVPQGPALQKSGDDVASWRTASNASRDSPCRAISGSFSGSSESASQESGPRGPALQMFFPQEAAWIAPSRPAGAPQEALSNAQMPAAITYKPWSKPQSPGFESWDAYAPHAISIPVDEAITSANADRLADLKIPEAGPWPRWNGELRDPQQSLLEDDLRSVPDAVLKMRYKQWLRSDRRWQNKLGRGWKGRRVLGRGGNGIVGLWEWEGAPGDGEGWESRVKRVAVKQMRARGRSGLMKEGRFMKWANSTGSKHFPQLYKRVYRDVGSGSYQMAIDSNRREVHRMIMEFCEGGDLHQVIRKFMKKSGIERRWIFMREDKVWAIFVCLAKALLVLDGGKETPGRAEGWTHDPIVHFDIKNLNVFIGKMDGVEEHARIPIHKMGDFGLAVEVPPPQQQDQRYLDSHSWRGTRYALAPEQDCNGRLFAIKEEERVYGSATNVYQLDFEWSAHPPYYSRLLTGGYTVGMELERGKVPIGVSHREHGRSYVPLPYSDRLKALVLRCLMCHPRNRPLVGELFEEANAGFKMALSVYREQDPDEIYDTAIADPEPDVIPDDWLSNTPPGYWEALSNDKKAFPRPLQRILDLQLHDKKRELQVWEARTYRGEYLDEVAQHRFSELLRELKPALYEQLVRAQDEQDAAEGQEWFEAVSGLDR